MTQHHPGIITLTWKTNPPGGTLVSFSMSIIAYGKRNRDIIAEIVIPQFLSHDDAIGFDGAPRVAD
jgi:hypothetical protein